MNLRREYRHSVSKVVLVGLFKLGLLSNQRRFVGTPWFGWADVISSLFARSVRLREIVGLEDECFKTQIWELVEPGSFFLNVKKDLVRSGDVFRHHPENPDDFRACYNLGTVLMRLRITRGRLILQTRYRASGRVPESYGCLGGVLLKLRRPRAVKSVETDCCVLTDSPCLYNLNVALRQLSRMNEAIALSFRILQISYSVDVGAPGQQLEAEDDHQITATTITRSSKAEGVVFICVKWGSKYDADYVNAMYRALKRHWTRTDEEMRLICMTDDTSGITSEVECKPFPPAAASGGWRAWWLKACIFSGDGGIRRQAPRFLGVP